MSHCVFERGVCCCVQAATLCVSFASAFVLEHPCVCTAGDALSIGSFDMYTVGPCQHSGLFLQGMSSQQLQRVCKQRVKYTLTVYLRVHVQSTPPSLQRRSCTVALRHSRVGPLQRALHVTRYSVRSTDS